MPKGEKSNGRLSIPHRNRNSISPYKHYENQEGVFQFYPRGKNKVPMAFLIARSMLSFGMFSRLHTAITERSVGLFSGSGPPALTAMAICLPRRVKVLAMWPHLFIFAALRYSNARPILLYYNFCF